ncbi:protein-L-isoaspartate O-methyltransferase family protein [Croceicoccus marinus]|uniref:Protein-L-isoaspartate O-methyltransferase n=1 Tax=Croceicoccus marinus TaxID=450378 RepID=A0A1Z1FE20_9SPHN|nr:protein-L-isoaspartate O-methyltransferase [Croceicoccus marinus]ARU16976.1 hypothetical protein A9D14_13420 [Croceicoccus marinus]
MASAATPQPDHTPASDQNVAIARKAMIDSQLRPSGISDARILAAMASAPREQYVAADQRSIAYMDRSVPLGEGRSLTAPFAQAMLLQTARPVETDKALLIGGATGYLAALLAPMVATLDVVEPATRLASIAGSKAGDWHDGPLDQGHPRNGPYDLIVIDGAVEKLPPAIGSQLAAGGRLVTGVVERGVTRIAIGRKAGTAADAPVALQTLAETGMPVLAEFKEEKGWSF